MNKNKYWDGVRKKPTSKEWETLYDALNEMLVPLGANGIIYATDSRVLAVMDALREIDGGTYSPRKEP